MTALRAKSAEDKPRWRCPACGTEYGTPGTCVYVPTVLVTPESTAPKEKQ